MWILQTGVWKEKKQDQGREIGEFAFGESGKINKNVKSDFFETNVTLNIYSFGAWKVVLWQNWRKVWNAILMHFKIDYLLSELN